MNDNHAEIFERLREKYGDIARLVSETRDLYFQSPSGARPVSEGRKYLTETTFEDLKAGKRWISRERITTAEELREKAMRLALACQSVAMMWERLEFKADEFNKS